MGTRGRACPSCSRRRPHSGAPGHSVLESPGEGRPGSSQARGTSGPSWLLTKCPTAPQEVTGWVTAAPRAPAVLSGFDSPAERAVDCGAPRGPARATPRALAPRRPRAQSPEHREPCPRGQPGTGEDRPWLSRHLQLSFLSSLGPRQAAVGALVGVPRGVGTHNQRRFHSTSAGSRTWASASCHGPAPSGQQTIGVPTRGAGTHIFPPFRPP